MSSNGYPFLTKKDIVAKIDKEDAFVEKCCLVLHSLQTIEEIETGSTKNKNRRGWMASHAVKGTAFANKILAGESLSGEDLAVCRGMVRVYRKQLAAHFRNETAQDNPELAAKGAMFGV